jgi:hypothetical protein
MWRIALLGLALTLGGCGYKTWSSPPFSGGTNPNLPAGDSETIRRVLGIATPTEPLLTEPGDIWPGQLPPAPTLQDIETTSGLTPQVEAPVPGSPLSRGVTPPTLSPAPRQGSSTPPSNTRPNSPTPQITPPLTSYATPAYKAPPRGPDGQIIQTPSGASVTTGGGPGYQTTTNPGGGQSIVVPNGNGTSTVIHSDGRIETIPTPK